VDGLTQVAVMKPESGDWTVLTRDRSRGSVADLCWSHDGTKVYFDRFLDAPRGIYSIPVLGGEPRLVLEEAMGPEALPDGSLLITRVNAQRNYQLYRFWPESGRVQPLPALLAFSGLYIPIRVFPDGNEAVRFGRLASSPDASNHVYAVEVTSGRTRRLAPGVSLTGGAELLPLAVHPDGRSVLIGLPLRSGIWRFRPEKAQP